MSRTEEFLNDPTSRWVHAPEQDRPVMTRQGIMLGITMMFDPERETYAARILRFGLTAYDGDPDIAARKVQRMFFAAHDAHEDDGTLDRWLAAAVNR